MTQEIKDLITKAGLTITLVTAGATGGYFISQGQPAKEIVIEKPVWNYHSLEGQVSIQAYNAVLQAKRDD